MPPAQHWSGQARKGPLAGEASAQVEGLGLKVGLRYSLTNIRVRVCVRVRARVGVRVSVRVRIGFAIILSGRVTVMA